MTGNSTQDVYDRLGVRKLINAQGTLTRLGSSRMAPEVTGAMAEAARHFVDLEELLVKSGEAVARMLGVEAAYISCGAAAGLALSTAACVAGDDPARIQRLPDTRGMRNKVATHRLHRNGYDQAIRQVGVELVEFGWISQTHPWQLEDAIDEQTAAVAYFVDYADHGGSLPLETVLEIAHRRGLPVIVDAAAEIPPLRNLHHFNDLGSDLVVFSGGKDIGGPQSSGLILGRKDLIRKCALNGNPNWSVGRSMKAGKEEIVGLVVALERYLAQDEAAEAACWEEQVAWLVKTLGALAGVHARRVCPVPGFIRPNTIPRAYVGWDDRYDLTVPQAVQALRMGNPAIAVGSDGNELVLHPQPLASGEERIVAECIGALLQERRRK
ncbi:MAG: aminotransferase class V-fold PLP-dependent enzyme [Anaerolineae bacterium]|nr:aminotransferase class V-fold PLP-dependent enzyme [Anaerolineae bacterium]